MLVFQKKSLALGMSFALALASCKTQERMAASPSDVQVDPSFDANALGLQLSDIKTIYIVDENAGGLNLEDGEAALVTTMTAVGTLLTLAFGAVAVKAGMKQMKGSAQPKPLASQPQGLVHRPSTPAVAKRNDASSAPPQEIKENPVQRPKYPYLEELQAKLANRETVQNNEEALEAFRQDRNADVALVIGKQEENIPPPAAQQAEEAQAPAKADQELEAPAPPPKPTKSLIKRRLGGNKTNDVSVLIKVDLLPDNLAKSFAEITKLAQDAIKASSPMRWFGGTNTRKIAEEFLSKKKNMEENFQLYNRKRSEFESLLRNTEDEVRKRELHGRIAEVDAELAKLSTSLEEYRTKLTPKSSS